MASRSKVVMVSLSERQVSALSDDEFVAKRDALEAAIEAACPGARVTVLVTTLPTSIGQTAWAETVARLAAEAFPGA